LLYDFINSHPECEAQLPQLCLPRSAQLQLASRSIQQTQSDLHAWK
jgi:hypothetical protein